MSATRNFNNEDNELRPMLEQIASEAKPYAEDPGSQYWANFRVRVMERVELEEAKRPAAFFGKVWEWFAASAVRPALAGLGAVAVAAMLIVNGGGEEIAKKQVAVAPSTTEVAPQQQIASNEQPAKVEEPASIPEVVKPEVRKEAKPKAAVIASPGTRNPVPDTRASEDYAVAQLSLSPAEADAPINYDDLSASELESVLESVQGM